MTHRQPRSRCSRGIVVADPQQALAAQTSRQVAHWVLAASRLDLDELASRDAWSHLERYLGLSLRRHLQGVIDHLDYLSALGVTTLSLMPVMEWIDEGPLAARGLRIMPLMPGAFGRDVELRIDGEAWKPAISSAMKRRQASSRNCSGVHSITVAVQEQRKWILVTAIP